MARLRTLKPAFFLNEELSHVPMAGRILFAGLWCLADRRGRLEDRPARIKAQLLPYDNCDVEALLGALTENGFLVRYEVGRFKYIQVVNFEKHQAPHYKEAESEIPAPPGHSDSPVVTFGVGNEQRARIMERDGFKCQQCGTPEKLSIDHIIPRSKGGSGDDENLQVLCMSCNASKNNREAPSLKSDDQPDVDPTLTQVRPDVDSSSANESGASPSVFRLPSSVNSNGLLSSVRSEISPDGDARAEKPKPQRHKPIDAEYIETLVVEFAPLLGGSESVREIIGRAMNHKASDSWKDKRRGLHDWLDRDVKRLANGGGNATSTPNGSGRVAGSAATGNSRLDPEAEERILRMVARGRQRGLAPPTDPTPENAANGGDRGGAGTLAAGP